MSPAASGLRRRLWVVDPSVSTPEDQGIAEILDGWSGESRIFKPCLEPGSGPGPGDGYDLDGVVVMGSAVSVFDELPWMQSLERWVRPILAGEADVAVLGICFGHQWIAHLAGAPVGFLTDDHRKRVGVESTDLRGGRLVEDRRMRVVVSHREEVKQAPAGYTVTASRQSSRIDGLEHESLPVFSYQFHPEAREDFAARAGFDAKLIGRQVRDDSRVLLGAFRRLVARDRTRSPGQN